LVGLLVKFFFIFTDLVMSSLVTQHPLPLCATEKKLSNNLTMPVASMFHFCNWVTCIEMFIMDVVPHKKVLTKGFT
jgi:hypothetical protein